MTAGTAALILLVAAPITAQPIIQQGIDVLDTATGTRVWMNFPAGFFCPGSAPFWGEIKFVGVPLATEPPGLLLSGDTIVERLQDAPVPPGGCVTVEIVVRALSMVSAQDLTVFCPGTGDTLWTVSACACSAQQPITTIEICDDGMGCGCGFFNGLLDINVCLTFTNVDGSIVHGPIPQLVQLRINSMPWCDTLAGALSVGGGFLVDSDCDGWPDLPLPGTTNFFPGALCGSPCIYLPPKCHENTNPGEEHLHCVEPTCEEVQTH